MKSDNTKAQQPAKEQPKENGAQSTKDLKNNAAQPAKEQPKKTVPNQPKTKRHTKLYNSLVGNTQEVRNI